MNLAKNNIDFNFDLLSNGFLTTFVRPESTVDSGKKTQEAGGTIGGETGGKKTSATVLSKGIIIEGEYLKLPARQKDALLLIANDNKITIAKVAEFFGINKSAAQKHFDALKTKNIITRKKGDKGGYWNIYINIEKLGI